MLLTRRPDALLHVKLANLWLLLAKKCLDCVSASRRDPIHTPDQHAEPACEFALEAGSRSAPIGTPSSQPILQSA
jgi:hypothetical protein